MTKTGTTRPGLVLLLVSVASFLASLDLFIVNIAFPAIRVAFPGGDLGSMSWILNGYTVMFAAFLAPAGRLADRYGRRRLFLIGVAIFTAASAACALAGSIPMLVAFRAVQAIGAGLVMPTSLALLLTAFPAAKRSAAVGMWASVGAAAAALGPPLGGLLVEASWRWVFLVNVPIGVLALVFGPILLRESKDTTTGVPDLLGALGLLAGVGGLTFALVEAPDAGWTSGRVLGGFVGGVAALAWAVFRAKRHPVPVLDLQSLKVPTLWLACVAMALFAAGFAAMLFGNVLFLVGIWHDSTAIAGLSQSAGPATVVVVSMFGGRLAHRFGPGPVAAVGALSFGLASVYWLAQLSATPDYWADMLPGQLLSGLGVGLLMPSLSSVVATVLPPDRWGAGSSMINTSRQVGTVLGTAILVVIYGGTQDLDAFRHGWIFIVATSAAAAVTGCFIAARRGTVDHHVQPAAESARVSVS
ncbi:MAG: major facilitator transporter [Amycolatopsis sp.]|uniref:MFS transporter n=1 Tax=Amycolatopsis sp. TaxID=37632 RepID=UPI002620EDBF|nr:MFS transporter [Amycolatopsis sp.]MCU1683377.1 major facilitator transporter [Amycolatopsis sp.]